MDKLRVGGACWYGEGRYVVNKIDEATGNVQLRFSRALGEVVHPNCPTPAANVTPAPFIPGDVVSLPGLIADCPRYSRGIATSGERNGHIFVTWQDGAQDLCLAEKLTLILPAQREQEVQHG